MFLSCAHRPLHGPPPSRNAREDQIPFGLYKWTLTSLRERLVKIGARIVRHGRYVVFQLAEVAVPRALFAAILKRIERLRGPPVPAT
jgi:Transposase DDE domain group 1